MITRGTGISPSLLIAAVLCAGGCVHPYTGSPVQVGANDTVSVLPRTGTADDDLRENWRVVMGRCFIVRRQMQNEAESIQRNNRAIGAVFAGLAAGFGAATTIYNAATDTPERVVTTVLGAGAALSTVPTFAYFGSDSREQEVRTRIAVIDRFREQATQLATRMTNEGLAVSAAVTASETADRERDSAQTAYSALEGARNQAREAREAAQRALGAAQQQLRDAGTNAARRRAAEAAVSAAQHDLDSRQPETDAASERMCQARSERDAKRTVATERARARDSARDTLHNTEHQLNDVLQRMTEACQ